MALRLSGLQVTYFVGRIRRFSAAIRQTNAANTLSFLTGFSLSCKTDRLIRYQCDKQDEFR
ncbi:hypothetical protein CO700_01810 [Citrobacter koseri]|nr:hypothetical protein CO700_01810 [Citrobacter koseri]KWZ95162.1 hypothetical protein HMPREF3220_04161 [Citrobacter koseri]KXA02477.1 hypothetical protein HMPREF3207_02338 [Citrobacter koseri]KXB39365.1 hypothetical protein HMPREF0208_04768 [Citrobacter koseri]